MAVTLVGGLGLLAREVRHASADVRPGGRAPEQVAAPTPVVAVPPAPTPADDAEAAEAELAAATDGGGQEELADNSAEAGGAEREVAIIPPDPNILNPPSMIHGQLIDSSTGNPLPGVTVVATSPQMQGAQTAITDENGYYAIAQLPTGDYLVTFYYLDATVERSSVAVNSMQGTPISQAIETQFARRPDIDIQISSESTGQGITIDNDYIRNIPVPGRTFEAALGAAAGSQGDCYGRCGVEFSGSDSNETDYLGESVGSQDELGVSFSGGSSIDNVYIIDE